MPIFDYEPGQSPEAPGDLYFYEQGKDRTTGIVLGSSGDVTSPGTLAHTGAKAGFFGADPVTLPALTYSRALESAADSQMRTALASLGLVDDQTTA